MSTINRKPFIKTLIESLTTEQIATLQAMIDGGGNQTVLLRTMNIKPTGDRTNITAADKGIHRCNLEANYSLFNGYLIYNDSHCVLIYYTDFQRLGWFNINLAKNTADSISEELSALELRSELDDTAAAEKAEIIETVNEAIADGDIKVVTLENGTNFTNLSDNLLSSLKAGDIITKEDSTGKHAYVVSYKKDGVGICLSYSAAGYLETVSYDYTGGHWVYNSTDIVQISNEAFKPFPSSWPTSGTTKAFCDAINADTGAIVGSAYLGDVSFSDLPFNGNGDLVVEIFNGPSNKKTIHLILNSGNIAPYKWEYTYWNDGVSLSGWIPMGDNNSAPVYDSTATYAIGDLVTYQNKLYECTTAVTSAEAFDSNKWSQTTLADAVLGMINAGY